MWFVTPICPGLPRAEVGDRLGTPHCSFFDANAPPDDFARESIECRALVYFGDCAPGCAQ